MEIGVVKVLEKKDQDKRTKCAFNVPTGLAFHEATNTCFVVEYGNHTVSKIMFEN